jgi:hypothetical protein
MAADPLSYALLADGTSDRALLPIIRWSLRQIWKKGTFAPPIFEPRQHVSIEDKIQEILEQYRPHLVFVHRDAENQPYETRIEEIPRRERTVPVIPVRMTEAWLLIDESALRRAAGDPNGHQPLEMPPVSQLERLRDPKSTLYDLLRVASGKKGRQLRKFKAPEAVHRLAELISDYSALRRLPAYKCFSDRLEEALGPFIEKS